MEFERFPGYFKEYRWEGKHHLYGYPADSYPEFQWISSLERRFEWLLENSSSKNTASIYLVKEMIEWGGSQNGVLQKFEDRLGEVNLYQVEQDIFNNIDCPREAIKSALEVPGLGLTYASKMLRFIKPDIYGALDSRIRAALLKEEQLGKIYDGNKKSMVDGYCDFLDLLNGIKQELESRGIEKPGAPSIPDSSWRAADIEMALFRWAEDL